MPTCAIITCRARSQDENTAKGGISYHRFPKEPEIRAKWVDVTGRKDWIPSKFSTICSKHFRETDFNIKKSGYRYLKAGAVPRDRIVYCSFSNETLRTSLIPCTSGIGGVNAEKNETSAALDTTIVAEGNQAITHPILLSPVSRGKINQSTHRKLQMNKPIDSDSNASTPRKRKFKSVITTKKNIIHTQKKQIKRLQAQNRRLKKKINKMEDLLDDIQQKFSLKNEDLNTLKRTNLKLYKVHPYK